MIAGNTPLNSNVNMKDLLKYRYNQRNPRQDLSRCENEIHLYFSSLARQTDEQTMLFCEWVATKSFPSREKQIILMLIMSCLYKAI